MVPTATKIKNRIITLPQSVGKQWSDKDITVFDAGDRLIIEPASDAEWEAYEAKLKKADLDIPPELIDEAVEWAKKNA